MDRLWPVDGAATAADLEDFYRYPATPDRPWVRVNFVSSLDGAVAVDGSSRGLSDPADRAVLTLLRDLADVVLVGVGTALVEGYRGLRSTAARRERRARLGLTGVPPVAVVSGNAAVPPDSPLLTSTEIPPIVLTCAAAPAQRRRALAEAGAEVVLAGDGGVDLRAALDALARRGLRRVVCEGGPTLFGHLVDADLVDELCLSLAPVLAGGDAGRIARGPLPRSPLPMRLAGALHADSLLLLRYRRTGS
ncbi:pyrimidine reductase family protein [Saccharopolyspora cebuensis]|uniref:Pyrimidine reductase family protein n=1 Tax=Saccharopolyspora cebuensis TaxID=418759 RepID=A0ABV4CDE3_9PSEU